MSSTSSEKVLYENLDTTFVNLWSLLRNLTRRGFVGRVRIEMQDYSADVFLNGSGTPLVHEVDRDAGTDTLEAAALHRVVLRARETPGTISVFEGDDQARALQDFGSAPSAKLNVATGNDFQPAPAPFDGRAEIEMVARHPPAQPPPTPPDQQGPEVIGMGGDLISAIERGVEAAGEDFSSLFYQVRLELADDYSFLDPMANSLAYANGAVTLNQDVAEDVYVSGLSEALRRVVEKVAVGDRTRRVRERFALELLGVCRIRKGALEQSAFRAQLDRIAGTKVI